MAMATTRVVGGASSRNWVVVGGASKGGILVRQSAELSSPKYNERLSYGAMVEELERQDNRLQYRLVHGRGPQTGFVTIRLKDSASDLVIPADELPPSVAGIHPKEVTDRPAMTFYAISDVHVEKQQNMKWLENLPRFSNATAIVAGDVGVNLVQIKAALELFKNKFDHVFYCFGNHDVWCIKGDSDIVKYNDSPSKLEALRQVCEELGVYTTARLIEGVWIVPVLGWYHTSWDTEPELQAPAGKSLARAPIAGKTLATDTHICKWGQFENGSEELAKYMDEENLRWGIWPLPQDLVDNLKKPRGERQHPVVSFSHFLPRLELMPEKRFLFQPGLAEVVGSVFVQRRVQELDPDLHIFGHSHFPWDMTLDDTRYRSWPLGTPDEQARRIESYPTEHTEQWHPLPVFDSEGRHYVGDEACWFSLMYSRIPREPWSPNMAAYVSAVYCPEAPTVPAALMSPGLFIEPASGVNRERREKYHAKSYGSMVKETGANSSSIKAAA